jgi:hypothetical protein
MMAVALTNEDRFVVSCEGEGEAGVRHKLGLGRYSGRKAVWASAWLDLVESGKSDATKAEESIVGPTQAKKLTRYLAVVASLLVFMLAVVAADFFNLV